MCEEGASPVSLAMESLEEVEALLGYRFRDPSLLLAALTHTSHPDAPNVSYQRLEFVGDAALGLLFANHIYLAYPELDPGDLSLLRAANISTEKLARVAVRHGLYRFLRRNSPPLDEKVNEFIESIKGEPEEFYYTAAVKAPKVLADIVESVVAAVYVDCDFDLKMLWMVFRGLLEPIVTKESLQLQPVTTLFQYCQKSKKEVDIKLWRNDSQSVANIYVDGKLVGNGSSDNKEMAKLIAAKEALKALSVSHKRRKGMDVVEEQGAKKRLHELCMRNRWSKPLYSVDNTMGPAHDKKFFCSVQIKGEHGTYISKGEPKSKVKEAENSAAFSMLSGLLKH